VSSSSPAPWVWWLLGSLVAVAVVVLVVVAARSRRARRAWEARLADAVAESTWLARDLPPETVRTDTGVGRPALWAAIRPRVDALESSLTALVASAGRDRVASVARLRDAVTDVGSTYDAYEAAAWAAPESLGAARQAQRQLQEALRAFPPKPVV
jgi:hypothetical protein